MTSLHLNNINPSHSKSADLAYHHMDTALEMTTLLVAET
jgi:hypothetical protein